MSEEQSALTELFSRPASVKGSDTPADILIDKSARVKAMKPEIKDGDGDGLIYDGTEDERAVGESVAVVDEPVDQTDTPEFKAWFGDSKVVDENGDPLTVYHATDNEFTRFRDSHLGENTEGNASSEAMAQLAYLGHWFSTDSEIAEQTFQLSTMEVYLQIKNPAKFDSLDHLSRSVLENGGDGEGFANYLIQGGNDGIEVVDEEFNATSFVAFYSEQIKSATDNDGSFDPNNPDITKSLSTTKSAQERLAGITGWLAGVLHSRKSVGSRDVLLRALDRLEEVEAMVEEAVKKAMKPDIRDGDGDGTIYDGTEDERAAPVKGKRKIDEEARKQWASPPKGVYPYWRIQGIGTPVPEKSSNWWVDSEDEMDGTSAFANPEQAIRDIAFGEIDSTTDMNYTESIEKDGGEAEIVVLMTDHTRDAPGAETLVVDGKVAATLSRNDVRTGVKLAMQEQWKDEFPEEAAALPDAEWEDVLEVWEEEISSNDFDDTLARAAEIIKERELAGG